MATKKKMLQAAAGSAAGGGPLAIEDVFSTYLYTGNGSTQTITNGIDLAGEGGALWVKRRSGGSGNWSDNWIFDSVRGDSNGIRTNLTNANFSIAPDNFGFSSTGFTVPNSIVFAETGTNYASWTFRKAPRFFDVVSGLTSDGSGNLPEFNHSLGTTPGCVFLKATDSGSNWVVFHRGLSADGANQYIRLNTTDAATNATGFGVATPTTFEVGAGSALVPSVTYVAYLFAHDPLGPSGDGSDGLIACGSYTGNGSTDGPEIDLGWEPQWIFFKNASSTSSWQILDNMRGISTGGVDARLIPNRTDAEAVNLDILSVTATGFKLTNSLVVSNESGSTYIYIAIRRGPMRAPESGTEVFAPYVTTSITPSGSVINNTTFNAGFPVDMVIQRDADGADGNYIGSRLTGNKFMKTETTAAETTSGGAWWDSMVGAWNYNANYGTYNFRRAPGFFDVVAWTAGSSTNRRLDHNLAVTPEFAISKSRSNAGSWWVYHKDLGSDKYINLNLTSAAVTLSGAWPSPNETEFGVRESHYFASGWTVITYLFATLPGISKVGSYTGNGSSQTIDCGFTTGARLVLIKATSTTGDWLIADTARGIVSGNDPYLELNTTNAEVTSEDWLDPDSSGFVVNEVSGSNANTSGVSYIYLAIS